MQLIKSNKITYFLLCSFIMCVLNAYLFTRYKIGTLDIKRIELETNLGKNDVLIYTNSASNFEIDFNRPYLAEGDSGVLNFDFGQKNLRLFRIYIGTRSDSSILKNITVITESGRERIKLSSFNLSGISKYRMDEESLLFANEPNGYLKPKKEILLAEELLGCESVIVALSFILALAILKIFKANQLVNIRRLDPEKLAVSLFFFSIFLPLPVFNVMFILSFLLVVRKFDHRKFLSSRVGILFLLYFVFFILNNLLLSSQFNMKLTETLLPFLFLPFYFACLPPSNYIKTFSITGFLMSLYFFSSSVIDFIVYKNINVFSFDAFTKYLHPVYFSYLLFFAIIHIQSSIERSIIKSILLTVMLFALVCCGSKLVISLTALFYALKYLKRRVYLGLGMVTLIVTAILLFPPTRQRFKEVFDINNLSILSDSPLKSNHDPRLNGLTIRLIIWQESLRSLTGKDFVLGKGVDEKSDKFLEKRLSERGLEIGQTKYDPHNQFIATFYKMGIIGLVIIIMICYYSFRKAVKLKNEMLLYTVLLFFAAMLTESVLQRAVGIYFFISILLLLSIPVTQTERDLENSSTRNKGNT